MRDEITLPFPNFNDAAAEVWEWINNSPHTLLGVWLLIHVSKMDPGDRVSLPKHALPPLLMT